MLAREIMTRHVCTITPEASVREAARILAERRISGMPVLNEQGVIIGMCTEADVISKRGELVRDIMSTDIISVSEETPIGEIAQLLSHRKIKRVPVVTNGRLVGLVSRADIVAAVAAGHLLVREW
ncbi:MAG TPA: CBS domain-containing protein [Ktedonobacterales bacterium]|jgi:CBS domain-containing protein